MGVELLTTFPLHEGMWMHVGGDVREGVWVVGTCGQWCEEEGMCGWWYESTLLHPYGGYLYWNDWTDTAGEQDHRWRTDLWLNRAHGCSQYVIIFEGLNVPAAKQCSQL